jgi:hypothetical protein
MTSPVLFPLDQGELSFEATGKALVRRSVLPSGVRVLTEKQSQMVADYLRKHHGINKTGWISWRKVSALGMGWASPPAKAVPPGPAPRTEIWLFIPS